MGQRARIMSMSDKAFVASKDIQKNEIQVVLGTYVLSLSSLEYITDVPLYSGVDTGITLPCTAKLSWCATGHGFGQMHLLPN